MPADKKRVNFNKSGRLLGSELARQKQALRQDQILNYQLVAIAKTGATQAAASAATGELWVTASHATLPDGVVMQGL